MNTAYELALLDEELSDTSSSVLPSKKYSSLVTSVPRVQTGSDRRNTGTSKVVPSDDKWISLRTYRKSKGLCFICGEKWSKDHQCKSSVQLHIVQGMIEHIQSTSSLQPESSDSDSDNLMLLSVAACSSEPTPLTMKLVVTIQGQFFSFLVDSGSTHSFLNTALVTLLPDVQSTKPIVVTLAGGAQLYCTQVVQQCVWEC